MQSASHARCAFRISVSLNVLATAACPAFAMTSSFFTDSKPRFLVSRATPFTAQTATPDDEKCKAAAHISAADAPSTVALLPRRPAPIADRVPRELVSDPAKPRHQAQSHDSPLPKSLSIRQQLAAAPSLARHPSIPGSLQFQLGRPRFALPPACQCPAYGTSTATHRHPSRQTD